MTPSSGPVCGRTWSGRSATCSRVRGAERRGSGRETDWLQILTWYDELVALTGNPVAALNRAVAVGEVDGPRAGLRALDGLDARLSDHHRLYAVRAHLHERAGDRTDAADLFAAAAHNAPSTAERNHLLRRAARARSTG
jgi:predicted RNA polymerase sigma factor